MLAGENPGLSVAYLAPPPQSDYKRLTTLQSSSSQTGISPASPGFRGDGGGVAGLLPLKTPKVLGPRGETGADDGGEGRLSSNTSIIRASGGVGIIIPLFLLLRAVTLTKAQKKDQYF